MVRAARGFLLGTQYYVSASIQAQKLHRDELEMITPDEFN